VGSGNIVAPCSLEDTILRDGSCNEKDPSCTILVVVVVVCSGLVVAVVVCTSLVMPVVVCTGLLVVVDCELLFPWKPHLKMKHP